MRRLKSILRYRYTNGLKQLFFEAVFGCPSREIRSQPTWFEGALDTSTAFALIVEHEDFSGTDDLALHTADFAYAIYSADTVTAPFDLDENVDCTGDLGAQCPQWQICRCHKHHVFEPE